MVHEASGCLAVTVLSHWPGQEHHPFKLLCDLEACAYNQSNPTLRDLSDWAQDYRPMPKAAHEVCSVTDGKQLAQKSEQYMP